MNEYENEMKSNPFTLSFGNKPFEYINGESEKTSLSKNRPARRPFRIASLQGIH